MATFPPAQLNNRFRARETRAYQVRESGVFPTENSRVVAWALPLLPDSVGEVDIDIAWLPLEIRSAIRARYEQLWMEAEAPAPASPLPPPGDADEAMPGPAAGS
jgi:hypothetical protein